MMKETKTIIYGIINADGTNEANMEFSELNNKLIFRKCNYKIKNIVYSYEDWAFLGIIANRIEELSQKDV